MKTTRLFYFVLTFIFLSSSALLAQAGDSVPATRPDTAVTAPDEVHYVMFDRDTIFPVHASLGPYSARERADALSNRLIEIKKKDRIYVDSFSVTFIENYTILSYRNKALYYVSKADADAIGKSREETAEEYIDNIQTAFSNVLERRTATYWLTRVGFTLLAIFGLWLIFFAINKAYKWVNKRLSRYEKDLRKDPALTVDPRGLRHKSPRDEHYFSDDWFGSRLND